MWSLFIFKVKTAQRLWKQLVCRNKWTDWILMIIFLFMEINKVNNYNKQNVYLDRLWWVSMPQNVLRDNGLHGDVGGPFILSDRVCDGAEVDQSPTTDPVSAGARGQIQHTGRQRQVWTQQTLVCSTTSPIQFDPLENSKDKEKNMMLQTFFRCVSFKWSHLLWNSLLLHSVSLSWPWLLVLSCRDNEHRSAEDKEPSGHGTGIVLSTSTSKRPPFSDTRLASAFSCTKQEFNKNKLNYLQTFNI